MITNELADERDDEYKWMFKSNESTNWWEIELYMIKVTFKHIDSATVEIY